MKSDRTDVTLQSDHPQGNQSYHPPELRDYGNARDLTRTNSGMGADGDPNDGAADSGLDANSTAS